MSAVSLTAVGQLKGQTAPYSLASITGTVYDSVGTTFTIPSPKSLVFFRGKTFTSPLPPENQGIVTKSSSPLLYNLFIENIEISKFRLQSDRN